MIEGHSRAYQLVPSKGANLEQHGQQMGTLAITEPIAYSDSVETQQKCHFKQRVLINKCIFWELSKLSL